MNHKEHGEYKEMSLFAIIAFSVVTSSVSNPWTPQQHTNRLTPTE